MATENGHFVPFAKVDASNHAVLTWNVDYGDGTPHGTYTQPAATCDPNIPMLIYPNYPNFNLPMHVYARSGHYTVTVVVTQATCDGEPGPSVSASMPFMWVPYPAVPIELSEVRSFAPLPGWAPLPGGTPPAPGMIFIAQSEAGSPNIAGPMQVYCTAPTSVAPGVTFTVTCTAITGDPTTSVHFSCPRVTCTFTPSDQTPTPSTTFGYPSGTSVAQITETMPYGFPAISWGFTATQGQLSENTELDVITAS